MSRELLLMAGLWSWVNHHISLPGASGEYASGLGSSIVAFSEQAYSASEATSGDAATEKIRLEATRPHSRDSKPHSDFHSPSDGPLSAVITHAHSLPTRQQLSSCRAKGNIASRYNSACIYSA
ncbi:hypothetical protein BAUCODRAFT_126076 [Baudoinia panamericana UAMH 10762]|uniref:Uncharacterized protein n=1 Tax=Baudoinia panamericana (strain UAMH 10762) TaxID=717646 RepID=M2MZG0_BAUPA|nr:uncharacterized protein BAUCODRAFT_126076 [Baudoinia panamericana UAMH 10762]EMC92059.1 hypothetical protein BAUCODRAFT_126076 [Baudoinia panamericana UAMH 10762]